MKKYVLTAVMASMAISVFGQATVVMNTAANDAMARAAYKNASALGFADDTFVTTAGSGTKVGLYAGTTEASMKLYGTLASFLTGGSAGYINASAASGAGTRTLTDIAPGATAFFQLRAWSGAYTSYEDAQASGLASVLIGTGPLVSAVAKGNAAAQPPVPANQIPWVPGSKTSTASSAQIWYVSPVPEPSTIALGALGLLGLALIRRRK